MNTISHRVVDNSLFVSSNGSGETEVQFAWPIAEVLDFDDVLVVRVDPEPGSKDNENIFGVDAIGAIIWKVPARKYIYDDSPYTGAMKAGKDIKLFNWDGTELLVNPSTGGVVQETYGR
jgi:hypothetical protein